MGWVGVSGLVGGLGEGGGFTNLTDECLSSISGVGLQLLVASGVFKSPQSLNSAPETRNPELRPYRTLSPKP